MIKLTVSLMLAALLAACGGDNTSGPPAGPQSLNPPSNQLVDSQPAMDDTGRNSGAPKVVTTAFQ
jgi:hypothetical protein